MDHHSSQFGDAGSVRQTLVSLATQRRVPRRSRVNARAGVPRPFLSWKPTWQLLPLGMHHSTLLPAVANKVPFERTTDVTVPVAVVPLSDELPLIASRSMCRTSLPLAKWMNPWWNAMDRGRGALVTLKEASPVCTRAR